MINQTPSRLAFMAFIIAAISAMAGYASKGAYQENIPEDSECRDALRLIDVNDNTFGKLVLNNEIACLNPDHNLFIETLHGRPADTKELWLISCKCRVKPAAH